MKPDVPEYISVLFMILTFALAVLIITGYQSLLIKTTPDISTRKKKFRIFILPGIFWLAFLAKISGMNFFHDWSAMPPRLVIAVIPPLIFAFALVASKKITGLISAVPQHWLILIQSFRIIMEIILLMLFLKNVIPRQMTFEGINFDILVGVSAPVIAFFAYRKKLSNRFIIGWNIFGLILLANIVIVAVLSAPIPFRVFMNNPANTVVAWFPFVWLPGFVVPVAYTMHFLSIKKCLLENKLLTNPGMK